MREIALLLVLANLGYVAWGRWILPDEPAPVAASPAASANVSRLMLASETRTAPAETSAVSTSDARAQAAAGRDAGGPQPGDAAPVDAGVSPSTGGTAIPQDTGGLPEGVPDSQTMETAAPEGAAGLITQDVPADGRSAGAAGGLASASTVALTAPIPRPQCLSLGPFLDLAETAEAAARLRQRGHMPSQRLADSPLWVGYWVYLAPFPTRDEAVAAVEKLRAGAIQDLYIEASGEYANAVSLGLYSDRERADALAATIRSLGYTPQINDKYRTASVYWVDVVLPPRVTLNPANYTVRSGRAVRTEEHECPAGTQMPGIVADARDEG